MTETYAIRETRHYYGPKTDTRYIRSINGLDIALYTSRAKAQAEIDRLDGQIYHLGHNESSRPTYQIRKATV
jgi:hypothetical protein